MSCKAATSLSYYAGMYSNVLDKNISTACCILLLVELRLGTHMCRGSLRSTPEGSLVDCSEQHCTPTECQRRHQRWQLKNAVKEHLDNYVVHVRGSMPHIVIFSLEIDERYARGYMPCQDSSGQLEQGWTAAISEQCLGPASQCTRITCLSLIPAVWRARQPGYQAEWQADNRRTPMWVGMPEQHARCDPPTCYQGWSTTA